MKYLYQNMITNHVNCEVDYEEFLSKKVSTVAILLSCLLILSSCSIKNNDTLTESSEVLEYESIPLNPIEIVDESEMFSDRDLINDYDLVAGKEIKLSDENGSFTITEEGTYIISGKLTNGQLIVDATDEAKIQIVLNGVEISYSSSAALYIKQADKVFVTVNENTTNILSNTEGFIQDGDEKIDSAVFSKEDITFNGNGVLNVESPYGNGIVSKDDLVLSTGTYVINAENHGIEAKDCIKISDAIITIRSEKDGIHVENDEDSDLGYIYIESGKFDIESQTDGISASGYIQINSGEFSVSSGGGSVNSSTNSDGNFNQKWGMWDGNGTDDDNMESAKGIKALKYILINSSEMILDTSDDSIHSDTTIVINDGIISISSGDDGIHANTQLVVNGGTISIHKSYEGFESQAIDITGGDISIISSDDGFNAAGGNDQSAMGGRPGMGMFTISENCYINISGGYIVIEASGDGIDSNGNISVKGGDIYISGPTGSGDCAFDYSGTAIITNGTIIAAGSNSMAQNFGNDSTQGSILINLQSYQSSGSEVAIIDSNDNVLAVFTPIKQYNSILISCPKIVINEKYIVKTGNYETEVTMTSLIYGSGSSGQGMPGGQGKPGEQGFTRP